jgi:hypothetical protein
MRYIYTLVIFAFTCATLLSQSNNYSEFKNHFESVIKSTSIKATDSVTNSKIPEWILTSPGKNGLYIGISDPGMNYRDAMFQALNRAVMQSVIIPACNKIWMNDFFIQGSDSEVSVFKEILMFQNSINISVDGITLKDVFRTTAGEVVIQILVNRSVSDQGMFNFSGDIQFYSSSKDNNGEQSYGKIVISTTSTHPKLKKDRTVLYVNFRSGNVYSDAVNGNVLYRYMFAEGTGYKIMSYSGLWAVYCSSFFKSLADIYNPEIVRLKSLNEHKTNSVMSIIRLTSAQEISLNPDIVKLESNRFIFKQSGE